MIYDNPAARLLLILGQGKEIGANTPTIQAWQHLLAGDGSLLLARIGKVMQLSGDTFGLLSQHFPGHRKSWGHWESQVRMAFMHQQLDGRWETFNAHIDAHALSYLHLGSDLLQAKAHIKSVSTDELMTLRESLNGVLSEVLECEQKPEVKQYLAKSLRDIIEAVDEYKLTGALKVLSTVEATLGHNEFDSEYRSFLKDTAIGQRILDILSAAANTMTVATGLPQLTVVLQKSGLIGN